MLMVSPTILSGTPWGICRPHLETTIALEYREPLTFLGLECSYFRNGLHPPLVHTSQAGDVS